MAALTQETASKNRIKKNSQKISQKKIEEKIDEKSAENFDSFDKSNIKKDLIEICKIALAEDFALCDITSDLILKNNDLINFEIRARESLILAGCEVIQICFDELTKNDKFKHIFLSLAVLKKDGDLAKKNSIIAQGYGNAKIIFAAERVILNILQHLSGIATSTNQLVKKLNNNKIKILDTRKTLPGLRKLQKYAVKIGGGENHRFNLSDMILIKDNHIAAAKSVEAAIKSAKKNNNNLKIEIECDNIKQVKQAINSEADIIMLDNMNLNLIKQSCTLIRGCKKKKILIEISGGISSENIEKYRHLDIDFISIGSLTHSVKAVDIGLDIL
jgi:nicotinate-nucleotide pyrophosphorylase (carboxylating)